MFGFGKKRKLFYSKKCHSNSQFGIKSFQMIAYIPIPFWDGKSVWLQDSLTRQPVLSIQKVMKYGMGETKKCAGIKSKNTAMERISFMNLPALQIYG